MKDYYHILITRKNTDSEYKKYNICSLKEIEGYYKSYIIGEKILIDNNKIKHSDISNFTIMKSSKKVEDKNISFNSNDDDIKNCTEEIKQNIELNIFETLKKFYYENKWFTITIIALILLSILNIILPIYKGNTASNSGYEFFGIIGDSSGLLGTILSGLAFLLLIYTATLQKNELSLQRKELEATRTELENQKKEFQIQNQTLKRQQFENTFFNMLSLQQNIINSLEYGLKDSNKYYKSRKVFEILCIEFFLKIKGIETDKNIKLNDKGKIRDTYYEFKDRIILDHYFRYLYRILKFVDENYLITDEEKEGYIDILRATLSPYELVLLYYDSLWYDKMRNFIDKYNILDNLKDDWLIENESHYRILMYENNY